MKKRILAILTALSMMVVPVCSVNADSGIVAVDGNVTIDCETNASEGTPVAIFILPQIIESETDVTAEKIEQINSAGSLAGLNIEYATIVKAGQDGRVTHSCKMKDSLTTGLCHVVFTYLDEESYIAGSFEHVGRNDVDNLVRKINASDASGYGAIFDEDINGTELLPAKEIMRKSKTDLSYYSLLSDKTDFHNVLFGFKPVGGFVSTADGKSALSAVVDAFNETTAWIKLRTESDTLDVLNMYNGEESTNYWSVEIGEGSDFATLSDEEKSGLLGLIKKAKLTEKEKLEEMFSENLAVALFRKVQKREEITDLISESSDYASYFTEVREIIDDADLSDYKEAILFNNVLDGNGSCETMDDILDLFEKSIPEEEKKGGGGSSVGASGGYKSNTSTSGGIKLNSAPEKPADTSVPSKGFVDVADNHWAAEYINTLYESGAINGVGNNAFAPEGSVARQDFVKILVGALKMELSQTELTFTDGAKDAYYAKYIMTAYEKGIISGIENGVFGIGQNISRQDAAVILSRVLSMYELKINGEVVSFNDGGEIADYAKDAVNKLSEVGIFGGDAEGNFNPKADITRAEACTIICRLMDKVKGE